MKQEEKTFTFRLPIEMLDILTAYADENDLSVAQVLRRVLKQFVASSAINGFGVE